MRMDVISDFLSALKHAAQRGKPSVAIAETTLLKNIGEVLVEAGYLTGVDTQGRKEKKTLIAAITYVDEAPRVHGVKRISKPSRRVYLGADEIYEVRQGHGTLILSTPEGVMTGSDARKSRVGGEALFEIW